MNSAEGDGSLRAALQSITDEYAGLLVGQQVAKITALRVSNPHSIMVLEKARLGSRRTFAFNCHAFTFGLSKVDECWSADEDLSPDGTFIMAKVIPMMEERPEGGIVLYFEGDRITHSGRINRGVVISKWGAGHTWQHALWEVPTCYGSSVAYYQEPAAGAVKMAYLESEVER